MLLLLLLLSGRLVEPNSLNSLNWLERRSALATATPLVLKVKTLVLQPVLEVLSPVLSWPVFSYPSISRLFSR